MTNSTPDSDLAVMRALQDAFAHYDALPPAVRQRVADAWFNFDCEGLLRISRMWGGERHILDSFRAIELRTAAHLDAEERARYGDRA